MIKIEGLGFSYPKSEIYKDFSAKFEKNKVSVILGHNGAGKTTLLKLISKLLNIKKGEIIYSEDIKDVGDIFYLPELNGCYTNLKVKDNIQFFKTIGHNSHIKEDNAINLLKLEGIKDSLVSTLSQGLIKRVALANCTVYNSNLLLLDEPTNGIDPETKDIIINYLGQAKKNKTIILATHDLNFAIEVADYIYIIDKGDLVLNEELNDKNFEELKSKYLKHTSQ